MLPSGPKGETVAPSSHHGNTRRRAPVGHQEAEQDPADAVGPAEHLLGGLSVVADADDQERVSTHSSSAEYTRTALKKERSAATIEA